MLSVRGGERIASGVHRVVGAGRLGLTASQRGEAAAKAGDEIPHAKSAKDATTRLGINSSRPLRTLRPLREVQELRYGLRRRSRGF